MHVHLVPGMKDEILWVLEDLTAQLLSHTSEVNARSLMKLTSYSSPGAHRLLFQFCLPNLMQTSLVVNLNPQPHQEGNSGIIFLI